MARRRLPPFAPVAVVLFLLGALVPATPVPAAAAISHYVAPNGSDAWAGTATRPWRTLQHAADVATGTIWVRSGTYRGFTVTRSGLSFRAYPGEHPVVRGDASRTSTVRFSGVSSGLLSGFTVTGNATRYGAGIRIKASQHVTIAHDVVRGNHSYGIGLSDSGSITVVDNDISNNDTGVEIDYGGSGTLVTGNRIHDNLGSVDASRGKDGINIYRTTGSTVVRGNVLARNGTHLEYYSSSNIAFVGNTLVDGSVLESGTDPGGECSHISFIRNLAFRTDPTRFADGLILRCAADSLVANNTLRGLDRFAFDIVDGTLGAAFGGSIEGLTIADNIVVQGRAYSIDTRLPASVVIDHDLVWGTSGAEFGNEVAYVAGHGNTDSLATFSAWTGYDAHGLQVDPRFADAAMHLAADSPALDAGIPLPGISYAGSAPDLGRWER